MSLWQALDHVLNVLWPAMAVAAGLALPLRWRHGRSWWRQTLVMAVLGALVLVGGPWILARDGAMLTYALMLLAQATWAWGVARRFVPR